MASVKRDIAPALKKPLVSFSGSTLLRRHMLAPSRIKDPCNSNLPCEIQKVPDVALP